MVRVVPRPLNAMSDDSTSPLMTTLAAPSGMENEGVVMGPLLTQTLFSQTNSSEGFVESEQPADTAQTVGYSDAHENALVLSNEHE